MKLITILFCLSLLISGAVAVETKVPLNRLNWSQSLPLNANITLNQSIDLVNIEDYGAVGDGTTNCTSAIQAAINAQKGDVYIPGYDDQVFLVGGYIDLQNGTHLIGDGQKSTLLIDNSSGIRIGRGVNGIYKWMISGLHIYPKSGATPLWAISLDKAREGVLENNFIQYFDDTSSASAIYIQTNCWSLRFSNNQFVNNYIGVRVIGVSGSQVNALSIIGGRINLNKIGVYVDIPAGYAQGWLIGGNVQIEGNEYQGIYLKEGSINGLHVDGMYGEYWGKLFYMVPGTGEVLNIKEMHIENVFVYGLDSATYEPIYVALGSDDYANITVSNVYGRHLPSGKGLASIGGANAKIVFRDCHAWDTDEIRYDPCYITWGSGQGTMDYVVGASAAATTPGSVVKKVQVFDEAGASIGYLAVYDGIT